MTRVMTRYESYKTRLWKIVNVFNDRPKSPYCYCAECGVTLFWGTKQGRGYYGGQGSMINLCLKCQDLNPSYYKSLDDGNWRRA